MRFAAIVLLVFVFLSASALAGSRVVVPQLPPSPYDDTEISTNVTFSAGGEDLRLFSLSLAVDATPSNTLQLAFGQDVNSDGVLDWQETDFLLGWRCGAWFFRDKAAEAVALSAKEPGWRRLEWRLALGRARKMAGQAHCLARRVVPDDGKSKRDFRGGPCRRSVLADAALHVEHL